MMATTQKTRKKDATPAAVRRRAGGAQPALVARVDLLPPSVELRRRQSATLRLLGLGLAGLLLIAVAGSFATSFFAGDAERRLAEEQARSAQLITEQNQYLEVSGIKAQLGDHETAQMAALFLDIDWPRMMRELDAALPAGMVLNAETVTIRGVDTEAAAEAEGAVHLDAPGVIEISFTANTPVFESTTPLLTALANLTGYVSARVDAVNGGTEDGYTVAGVVQLNASAFGGTARAAALDEELLVALRVALQEAVTAPPAPATDPDADTGADPASGAADENTEQ